MDIDKTLSILEEHHVEVFSPSTFDTKDYIDRFLQDMGKDWMSLIPVGEPEFSIDFMKEYREDGTAYCTVSARDEEGFHLLLSENENGYLVGHIHEVETYIENHCPDGFYDDTDAREKIENYEDQFFEKDEAYDEHLIQLGEELADFFEPEEPLDFIDIEPTIDERFYHPAESEFFEEESTIDLSDATTEEQIAAIEEASEPGGKIWDALRLVEMAEEHLSPEEKVDFNDLNLNVSEKVIEYFRPTEEKLPYFEIMQRGFIPFELREGFRDSRVSINPELQLTREIVNEVRQKIDPDFGKVAGIDTTTFHVRKEDGFEKNVSIIPMKLEEFKPYLTGREQFDLEDITSVRAIKELGDSMEVQGVDFHINNLVTFEFRTESNEVYRSSLIMDDSGQGRARLDFLADDYEHTFRIESGSFLEGENVVTRIHFDSLDRTNVDTKNHFRVFEQKGEGFREDFLTEVHDRLPAFFDNLCTRLDHDFRPETETEMGRKDYMELNMDRIQGKIEGLHHTVNLTELYRESLLGKASAANLKCATLDDTMNYADMDRKKLDPDSQEYKEISEKMEAYKEEYAKSYHDYLGYKSEYLKIEKDADSMKEEYLGLIHKFDRVQNEYDKLMGRISANGSERDLDNSKLTPEERYSKYCDIALLRADMVPTEVSYSYESTVDDKLDLIKEAYQSMEKEVEAYNETVDHPCERIQFMPDLEGIYTYSGYAVEADSIAEQKLAGQQYEPLANREDSVESSDRMVRKPDVDEDGKAYFGQAEIYSMGKPEGVEASRIEIRDRFLKDGIRCGVNEDKMNLVDNSLSGRMLDNDLLHEVDAIRMTVREHEQEPFESLESYRDAIKEHKQELDERTEASIQKFYEWERGDVEPSDETYEIEHKDTDSEQEKDLESKIRSNIAGLNGKINVEKNAELSTDKEKELKEEAVQEAKHSDRTADEIYEEKKAEVKEELESVREDIIHYRNKMESFRDIPSNYLRMHCGYGVARTEYNAAIHQYEKLGGKIDEDAFVTKGISNSEMFLIKHEFLNSKLPETLVLDGMYGKQSLQRIKDVFQDSQGAAVSRYSGMAGKSLEVLFRPIQFVSWPAVKIFEFFSRYDGETQEIEKDSEKNLAICDAFKQEILETREQLEDLATSEPEKIKEIDAVTMEAKDIENTVDELVLSKELDGTEQGFEESMDGKETVPLSKEEPLDFDQKESELERSEQEADEVSKEQEDLDIEQKEDRDEGEKKEAAIELESRLDASTSDQSEDMSKDVEKGSSMERYEEEPKDRMERPETEKDDSVERINAEAKIEQPEEKFEKEDAEKDEVERPDSDLETDREQNKDSAILEESQRDLEQPESSKDVEEKEPSEESKALEKEEALTQDIKEEAIASDGEELTSEDHVQIFSAEPEEAEDAEEPEDRKETQTTDDSDRMEHFLDSFSDVLDVKETFEDLCKNAIEDILRGHDPSEVLDAMTDCMADYLNSETLSVVSDTIYDAINALAERPMEALDHIMDRFEAKDIPEELREQVMERIGDLYDEIERPYEDTASGEIGDIEFTMEGTYQNVTGMEDLNLGDPATLPDMEIGAENIMEIEQFDQDLEILQQAQDIGLNLESDGISVDVASDVSNDMFDQIANDFSNGQDVFDQDYIEQLQQRANEQAQDIVRSEPQNDFSESVPQDITSDSFVPDVDPNLDPTEFMQAGEATEISEVAEELASMLL